jgi:hypothetical protein
MPRLPRETTPRLPRPFRLPQRKNESDAARSNIRCTSTSRRRRSDSEGEGDGEDDENTKILAALELAIDSAIKKTKAHGNLASLETLLKKKLAGISPKSSTSQQKKAPASLVSSSQRKKTPTLTSPQSIFTLEPPLTQKDLLSVGLSYVGFSVQRQQNVKLESNIERFKGFYGLEPRTLVAVFTDVKDRFPSVSFRHLLLTMNWLTLYDIYIVLSGRWGYHHDSIARIVFEGTRMLQSFLKDKVGLHLVDMTAKVPLTMDTVNFTTYEIRTDPSSKWYDPKSHSSGLVSVFLIVAAFVF